MELDIYQVDAFTDTLFKGNPAAVCPLDTWLSAEQMQNIAAENNLAETAFFRKGPEGYDIKWFTPTSEVDLCGHATLATAHVLFQHLDFEGTTINFNSKSGPLKVSRRENELVLNFPITKYEEVSCPEAIIKGLKCTPLEMYKGMDYMCIFNSEEEIRRIEPDFVSLSKLDNRGIIVTSQGNEVDFVSRFFAPNVGINEDPVTGSAHTMLAPYWSQILNKQKLTAKQLSLRGGDLVCEIVDERVLISGRAITYLKGSILA